MRSLRLQYICRQGVETDIQIQKNLLARTVIRSSFASCKMIPKSKAAQYLRIGSVPISIAAPLCITPRDQRGLSAPSANADPPKRQTRAGLREPARFVKRYCRVRRISTPHSGDVGEVRGGLQTYRVALTTPPDALVLAPTVRGDD